MPIQYGSMFVHIPKAVQHPPKPKPKVKSKECIKCHAVKPLDDFAIDKHRPDNHKTWCKECAHEQSLITMAAGRSSKRCSVCGEVKPIRDFRIDRSHCDGHASACKDCVRKREAKRRNKKEMS